MWIQDLRNGLFLMRVQESGLWDRKLLKNLPQGQIFTFSFSHFHYDHIQGLPFFTPAYIPGNRIFIHGGHDNIEEFLRDQMRTPFFPIDFDTFQAEFIFHKHSHGETVNVCNAEIKVHKQNHPGDSYGFRVQQGNKSVIYSTDAEHPNIAHGKSTTIWILLWVQTSLFLMLPIHTLNQLQLENTGVTQVM